MKSYHVAMRTGLNVILNIMSVFCTSLYHHGFARYVRNCTGDRSWHLHFVDFWKPYNLLLLSISHVVERLSCPN